MNLGRIAYHIQKGDLDPSQPITMKTLFDAGILSKIKHGVKILGKGSDRLVALGMPINLEATDFSETAIEALKQTGGSANVQYRTPLILR